MSNIQNFQPDSAEFGNYDKDYESDGWKDSVSNEFLLFMGFLISCLLNVFVGIIFGILLWDTHYDIQIWKLFPYVL